MPKNKIISKRCPGCKDTKPVSEFYKDRTTKNGLRVYCKSCQNLYRQTENGKVAHRKGVKKYYRSFKGNLRNVFRGMLIRCNNPKHKQYKRYGGRGIKVKFVSFDDFYDYVVNELKADPRGLTIDRIDNDGDYARGNIRFVTQGENNRNKNTS